MDIYQDVGHEREFAIPISLISRAKSHSHAHETHVNPTPQLGYAHLLPSNETAIIRGACPFFPGCSSRQRLSSVACWRGSPEYRNARCLSSLPSWRDGDDIAPGCHTRT